MYGTGLTVFITLQEFKYHRFAVLAVFIHFLETRTHNHLSGRSGHNHLVDIVELSGHNSLSGHNHLSELSGYGFESRYSHLNFRYRACFEQGVP